MANWIRCEKCGRPAILGLTIYPQNLCEDCLPKPKCKYTNVYNRCKHATPLGTRTLEEWEKCYHIEPELGCLDYSDYEK